MATKYPYFVVCKLSGGLLIKYTNKKYSSLEEARKDCKGYCRNHYRTYWNSNAECQKIILEYTKEYHSYIREIWTAKGSVVPTGNDLPQWVETDLTTGEWTIHMVEP